MSALESNDPSPGRIARDVVESLLEGCQVVDFDYRYLYLNASAVAQSRQKVEEMLGRTMMECYPGIERTPMFAVLQRCMETRRHERMENEFTWPDGEKGWFELRFLPVPDGVCILSLDVTESKRAAAALASAEEQLRQAQKMEAVGRLAGGVAHDFNNLLSVILSYATLLLGETREGDPMREDLVEIKRAGERAAGLTAQLLAFSRQQLVCPRVVDLQQLLGGMTPMLGRLIGEDVTLKTVAGEGLGRVKADPGQLEQVVMNLVVNARDAMPRGGVITLEAKNVDFEAPPVDPGVRLNPGHYVMLAVSDTGVGMDAATLARIFEPFFTTKSTGKGTGLGLSTVYGIAQKYGGTVWAYSEPGRGSTFKLYLPRTDELGEPLRPPVAMASPYGRETVLLVEDDEQLRLVARGILARHGYKVLDAKNGGEALLMCEQEPGPLDLLLTDVVLPRMSGRELADRLTAARPGLKVLFMSGYTDDAIFQHRVLDAGTALLQKPLTPDALLRRVREVLGPAPT